MQSFGRVLFLGVVLILTGCATSSPIQQYNKSKSHFGNPPELIEHNLPPENIYRIYHRASTGLTPITAIRQSAEHRADEFARYQGKSIVILGEKISSPPYILGNFPRIELVFALVDEPSVEKQTKPDKYFDLERIKKLLDAGVLTQDEFDREKASILKID